MTVAEAVASATHSLRDAGVPNAARDARRLAAHALGIDIQRLTLMSHEPFTAVAALEGGVARRIRRQPVSQIVGWREFWGRRFRVTPDVLDPRPETECLVQVALTEPFKNVLDLGVGTGCILLTLLAERAPIRGTGSDVSAAALAVAQRNAADLGLTPELILSNWFDRVGGRWDLIVSNPPYIAAGELAELAPELAWEPQLALSPGEEGLEAYRCIAAGALRHLAPGGRILLEIGPKQARAVARMLGDGGLQEIRVTRDLDGRERVVSGRRTA